MASGGELLARSSRIAIIGALVGVIEIAAVALAFILVGQREWSCQYRYWSDGSHNDKSVVPAILGVTGVVVGLVVAAICVVAYARSGRNSVWLWPVAVGLVPLALGTVILLATGGNPGYDCGTG